jgi:hypothetical protein
MTLILSANRRSATISSLAGPYLSKTPRVRLPPDRKKPDA